MPETATHHNSATADNAEVVLLSRLLSDIGLRKRFCEDREQVVAELTDDATTATFLSAIDFTQLDAQAETLLGKRQHEIAELLPLTWRRLGNDARKLFREYAATSLWPEGHLRHLFDACAFVMWLRQSGWPSVDAEFNRISFAATGGRFAIRIVRETSRWLPGLQFLARTRSGRVRQLILRSCIMRRHDGR